LDQEVTTQSLWGLDIDSQKKRTKSTVGNHFDKSKIHMKAFSWMKAISRDILSMGNEQAIA
jgi:hypothetical protein